MEKYQKRIRLKYFDYIGCYRYSVTMCTNKKKELFIREDIVKLCISILREVAEKFNFDIWVYCFMPDHIHILSEGKNNSSNLKKFMSLFKQKTGFEAGRLFKVGDEERSDPEGSHYNNTGKGDNNVVRGFSLAGKGDPEGVALQEY